MTMMISKFHRLISSKILWGMFAVVISIAMVGLFSDMPNLQRANAEASSVGTLDGEPVPYQEFQNAYANTRLQAALAFGQALPRTEEVEERLRELAWKRVISLRQIRELNIQASDAEVLGAIQQQSMFRNQNGQFDTRIYAVFLNRFLVEQMGIGQKQFEAYMREEVAITKLQQLVAQSILIAPAELKRAYQTVTDQFAVDFIEISTNRIPEVSATIEEAEEFYTSNPESFRSPEKAIVTYAEFSITNALAKVQVTEEDLLAYYNENIERYRIEPAESPQSADAAAEESQVDLTETEAKAATEGTDEENPAGAEANETVAAQESIPAEEPSSNDPAAPAVASADETPEVFDLTLPPGDEIESPELPDSSLPELNSLPDLPQVSYQDFDEVKEEIDTILRREKARLFAGEAATDFVLAVQDAAYRGESFTEHAEKAGVPLKTTAPFAQREIPNGIDAGTSFSRDAFDLGTSLTDSFSDPIDGRDTIYVLSLEKRLPSAIPPFSEVQEDAMAYASKQKAAEALVEYGETFKTQLTDQLSNGEDFAKLAEAQGYTVTSLKDVTAAEGIEDSPYANILFRGFLSRNQGELTDLLPADDQLLLAYVRQRTPAPAQSFTDYRPRIVSNLVRERTQRIFDAFQDHLLDKASFSERLDEEETSDEASSSSS